MKSSREFAGETRADHVLGGSSGRRRSRAISFDFSSSRVICGSGSTARSFASTPTRKSNGSARACRSSRTASTISEENRAAPHRSDRDRAAFRQRPDQRRPIPDDPQSKRNHAFLHRLALRALRSRYSSADARPVQFQQSARRLSGLPRLRPHHRDRSEPRDSGSLLSSIAEGVVRAFQGQKLGESQKDLCGPARAKRSMSISRSRNCRKPIRISSSTAKSARRRHRGGMAENDRWYGVRGFFKWLESKTYKMHVRVLLSRYRAYTTCPDATADAFSPRR